MPLEISKPALLSSNLNTAAIQKTNMEAIITISTTRDSVL